MYNRLLLVIKKNKILPSAAPCMDVEGIMLSEITHRERQILYNITHIWNLKKHKKTKYNKTETDTDIENKLVVTSVEKEGGRGNMGVGD